MNFGRRFSIAPSSHPLKPKNQAGKNKIKKIIIWLFERFCYDEWVAKQIKWERDKFAAQWNLKEDEIDEAMLERQDEPLREAYYSGKEDGYKEAQETFET
jgi:flagellar biosynthesis/type III secretory pathway protein FliH